MKPHLVLLRSALADGDRQEASLCSPRRLCPRGTITSGTEERQEDVHIAVAPSGRGTLGTGLG